MFPVLLPVFLHRSTWQRRNKDEKLGISGEMLREKESQDQSVDGWSCFEQALLWSRRRRPLADKEMTCPWSLFYRLPVYLVITWCKGQDNPRLNSPNRHSCFFHRPVVSPEEGVIQGTPLSFVFFYRVICRASFLVMLRICFTSAARLGAAALL